ncbi:MAG: glycosyltransferase family 2 protein [Chitinophagaceae bacterium]|nr:glycosyltransferase family 2 protein [Chitinophagaceae bacterium]
MLLSIIIINYNQYQLTCNCIRSVKEYSSGIFYEIILVDNASTEVDARKFKLEFPEINLVLNENNEGFAKGNNKGIDVAKGDFILLLNNDTILQENTLEVTLNYFLKQENAGVLGCRMIYPDGKVQYSARRFRSISWELMDLLRFIPLMMPYAIRSRLMLGKYFRHDANIECDWINGAFFLFRKKILSELPDSKLDDRFFMYGEDQLWCEQIKKIQYKVLFFSGSTIIHIGSGSTNIASQLKLRKIITKRELEIMRLRKGRGLYYYVFVLIYVSKESVRNFVKSIVLKLTGQLIR